MSKPVLVFGYGNLSRGDDALGPLFLERIKDKVDCMSVEILSDFQLQIEHSLDLDNRKKVLFVDASDSSKIPFGFFELQASRDESYTTHAMSPSALLQVYQTIKNQRPPSSFLLSIQGINFELGEPLSIKAEKNLQDAIQFAECLLNNHEIGFWRQQQKILNEESHIA